MVDLMRLERIAARRGGSSPSIRTITILVRDREDWIT